MTSNDMSCVHFKPFSHFIRIFNLNALRIMEKATKVCYKYCMVPKCKSTSKSTPDKVFFCLPSDAKLRNRWCQMMRRDSVSPISCLYCCEDHFNVKEDTANYIQYNIMKEQGEKCSLRLNKGVVPHIFLCQKQKMPPPVTGNQGKGVVKRQRLAQVNESLSEYTNKRRVLEISEPKHRRDIEISSSNSHTSVFNINQAGPSTSLIKICDDYQTGPCSCNVKNKLQVDKAVQVNIKQKYRSKGVNVNIRTKRKM